MDEYMPGGDLLLVGKPGGLTTAEAVARGLPRVMVHPIPGEEQRNADHLLDAGAAIRGNNLHALAWEVDALLDGGQRRPGPSSRRSGEWRRSAKAASRGLDRPPGVDDH